MPHDTVLVRLDPGASARSKYLFSSVVAPSLQTRPFLGLRIWTGDHSPGITDHRWVIYPIATSPFKGPGTARLRCFSLLPTSNFVLEDTTYPRVLSLDPPLPPQLIQRLHAEGKNLYLHIVPELHVGAASFLPARAASPTNRVFGTTPYRLLDADFKLFLTAVETVGVPLMEARALDERAAAAPCPDPDVEVTLDWKTFGETRWPGPGGMHTLTRSFFVFELLDVNSEAFRDPLELVLQETVETDISLYQQMLDEYANPGVNNTISTVTHLRKVRRMAAVLLKELPRSSGNLPVLDDWQVAAVRKVQANLLPHDSSSNERETAPGGPSEIPDDEQMREDGSDSESDCSSYDAIAAMTVPHHFFPDLPRAYPQVPYNASDIKVVAFDVFGVILDRQAALQSALELLCHLSPHRYAASALRLRYESLETLTASSFLSDPDGEKKDTHKNHDGDTNHGKGISDNEGKRSDAGAKDEETVPLTLRTLVQRGLHNFLEVYGITTPESSLSEDILNRITKDPGPQVYPDVLPALQTLSEQGKIHLVCMHPQDSDIQHALDRALPSGLCSHLSTGYSISGIHLPCPTLYPALLKHCDARVPGITSAQILLVTTGAARQVEGASKTGFPTVLLSRRGNAEADVDVAIPGYTEGPKASLGIATLAELCTHLDVADV